MRGIGIWLGDDSAIVVKAGGGTLTVSHSGDSGLSRIYNLDGSESRFTDRDGRVQYIARPKWVGSALVVALATDGPSGTWEDLFVYSLDHGPKLTLVHVGTQATAPMMFTQTKTYRKSQAVPRRP
jgi:hypothetical protein